MKKKLLYSLFGGVAAAALVLGTALPANAYHLLGPKWNGTVYVSIISGQPSAISSGWSNGTSDWNSMTDVSLYVTSGAAAAIYARTTSQSSVSWDGITYWTATGSTFNTPTNAYVNSYYTNNYAATTTRGVAAHELGHAIGLDHTSGCVLMNGYTSSRCGLYRPTTDDINGVNALY